MKLFRVDYMDDADFETYLTIGNSIKEVEERETRRLQEECACFMKCWVSEINEVNGLKIIVAEENQPDTSKLTEAEIDCFNYYIEDAAMDIAFGNSDWNAVYKKIVGDRASTYARKKMDYYRENC